MGYCSKYPYLGGAPQVRFPFKIKYQVGRLAKPSGRTSGKTVVDAPTGIVWLVRFGANSIVTKCLAGLGQLGLFWLSNGNT